MKLKNEGFTLVELLICIVIFGVVLAAVFGFMMTGANSFNTVNDRLDIQLQSQLSANQISEYIIDCNVGICTSADGRTVYILNEEPYDGKNYTVHIFKTDGDTIKYGRQGAEYDAANQKFTLTDLADSELTGYIDEGGMQISLKDAVGTAVTQPGTTVSAVELFISFSKRSAKYTVTKTIALRNNPQLVVINP